MSLFFLRSQRTTYLLHPAMHFMFGIFGLQNPGHILELTQDLQQHPNNDRLRLRETERDYFTSMTTQRE